MWDNVGVIRSQLVDGVESLLGRLFDSPSFKKLDGLIEALPLKRYDKLSAERRRVVLDRYFDDPGGFCRKYEGRLKNPIFDYVQGVPAVFAVSAALSANFFVAGLMDNEVKARISDNIIHDNIILSPFVIPYALLKLTIVLENKLQGVGGGAAFFGGIAAVSVIGGTLIEQLHSHDASFYEHFCRDKSITNLKDLKRELLEVHGFKPYHPEHDPTDEKKPGPVIDVTPEPEADEHAASFKNPLAGRLKPVAVPQISAEELHEIRHSSREQSSDADTQQAAWDLGIHTVEFVGFVLGARAAIGSTTTAGLGLSVDPHKPDADRNNL